MQRALPIRHSNQLHILPVPVRKPVPDRQDGNVQERRVEPRVLRRPPGLERRLVHHLLPAVVVVPEAPHEVVVRGRAEGGDQQLDAVGLARAVVASQAGRRARVDVAVCRGAEEARPPDRLVEHVAATRAEDVARAGGVLLGVHLLLQEERVDLVSVNCAGG